MWQFADSRFADHIFFVILQICDLRTQLFFKGLKRPHIKKKLFLLTMLSFRNKGRLLSFGTDLRVKWHFVVLHKVVFFHHSKPLLDSWSTFMLYSWRKGYRMIYWNDRRKIQSPPPPLPSPLPSSLSSPSLPPPFPLSPQLKAASSEFKTGV
jgi:hypothetical protein